MVHDHHINSILPLSVLVSSFLGSWHCVGMCGGLVAASTSSPLSVFSYHLGRLIGYCTVGALAGGIGLFIVPKHGSLFSTLFMSLFSLYFIFLGVAMLTSVRFSMHFRFKFVETLFSKYIQKNALTPSLLNSGLVGLFSVCLPCGWLYSFVIATVPLKSPLMSISILAIFWLGTLPALAVSPIIIRNLLLPIKKYLPKASGIVLILAGLASLLLRFKS